MIARYRDSVILILTGWILDWIIRKSLDENNNFISDFIMQQ